MSLKFRLKKWYNRFLFNLSASECQVYNAYHKYIYRPEQGSLAEFLDNYSRRNSQVTFLQVGANDGFKQDHLQKFIKRDNWRGVMLEPQPDVFNNFLVRLHRKRPEIITINAALDARDGTRPLYRLSISNERWATGLSSFNREVLVKKVNDGSMMKHVNREGISLPDDREDIIVAEEVPTISPESLLEKFGDEGFRLLAVDTEGYDYEILKMLDLDRISPEVIIYEEVFFDDRTKKECRAYLENHGYSVITMRKDVLATRTI